MDSRTHPREACWRWRANTMMKAKDMMSVEVVSIGPKATVHEATQLMLQHGVSALPVLARDGVLMGILTEGDLSGRTQLRRNQAWPYRPAIGDSEAAGDQIKAQGETVKDVMSRDVVTADSDATINEVAQLIARHDVKRVLILRGEKVVGVVSRTDLIRGIATAHQDDEAPASDQARCAVLNRIHVEIGLPRNRTGATIRNGKIVLWGTVASEAELRASRVVAEDVVGRERVVSYMRIAPRRQTA